MAPVTDKKLVGKITHFFPKVSVAVVELRDALRKGDRIVVVDRDGSFEQRVDSMQVEHEDIAHAEGGQAIGLKVTSPTKNGAEVYKIVE